MILVLAPRLDLAEEWIRASGTDPVLCVIVTKERQMTPVGVYDRHQQPRYTTSPPDFYEAWEFTEIVEVGGVRWWDNSEDAMDCLRVIRQEIAEFREEVVS